MRVEYITWKTPRKLKEPVNLIIVRRQGKVELAKYHVELTTQYDLVLLSKLLRIIREHDISSPNIKLPSKANVTSRAVYNALQLGYYPVTQHIYIHEFDGIIWVKFDKEGNIVKQRRIISEGQMAEYEDKGIYPRKLLHLRDRLSLLGW